MPGRTATRPAAGPAWDTVEPGRRGQSALVTAAVLLGVPGLVLTGMRVLPPADDAAALVASFVPYAIPLLGLALGCLLVALVRARRRARMAVPLAVVAVLLAAQLSWQLPYLVPDDRPVVGPAFGLLSLNTYKGEADPDQVLAATSRADVVVLVEVTPALVSALDARGWRDRFPFDAGASGGAVANTVVFSRYPLSGSRQFGSGSFDQWATTVDVPGTGPVALVAVHPCNPYCGEGRWAREHEDLRRVVAAELDRPLVVAGDFNAVVDHGPMQQLHRLGLRSAADLLGTGWAPTYPAGRALPPLLAIDHVLVDPALAVADLERVPVDGTDHLGLLAHVGRSS
ncbi:endonuclease/exonuclease/phosphatase family protein [Microlunatus capsulatus]|uniref:Endonuclease/exonuclease/phosphatase (EEP) superfamily protein YafD n=1 Tax=Microlunatus capsulatus TaxID=99117 RepID=A0ABS4Z5C5_9ACTN|nr:endonuclease/exonuclease/phosphatase family protein [Microlunatus capsulatus]MBP2416010.1 endonuclease/exonuclease/phosphatase (EEP) superfamily protein YafD [Microlunatus capsulatus]